MGQGSDIAVDTAMATILSSDLLKIPETIRLSQLTIKTIYQNLFWAFIYNLIGIPIAAGIFLSLIHICYTDAKTDFIREITNRAKEQITYPTNME